MIRRTKIWPDKKQLLLCLLIALAIMVLVMHIVIGRNNEIAPAYEVTVKDLVASCPEDVQEFCRPDWEYYSSILKKHDNCVWVWCGGNRLFAVRADRLTLDPESCRLGKFVEVHYTDQRGRDCEGYIIDLSSPPVELARIRLTDARRYDFENVSMTIRSGIRSGELTYEDVFYLWEKGRDFVYVIPQSAVTTAGDKFGCFTDDGGRMRVCHILDTDIEG